MANQNPSKKPGGSGSDDKFEWRKAARTLGFWAFLIIAVIFISSYFGPTNEELQEKSFSEYRQLLEDGKITSATIIEREFHGTLQDGTKFKTILPFVQQEQVTEWEAQKLKVIFKERATNWFGYVLTSILPWVVLIFFWFFLMRRMQGGGTKGIFSFGKSRAKLIMDNRPKVTLEDFAGGDEAKEELHEIIEFLKDPKKFDKLGGRIPKGALLIGPPGTGKTLLGRAIAGEAGVPFFNMSGADFVEMFVGVGASRVRDLFEQGKKNAPCIIFIDEIDAVGRQRGAGLGGGHDEREQTLNQLLVEMDGFETNEGVILVAATNRPDVLDPALLRPGRFDRQIVVDRPDVKGREGILRVHTKNIPLAPDVDLKVVAKGTPGLAGADIANLVNEAALEGAKRDADKVYMIDFENAKDKIMMGSERRSMLISDEEKKLTAYHEAGHVLVALKLPGSDPVHKVTIIPRGRALGVTHYLPIDEKHSWSKKYIENKLVHLAGGRAAERIIFDDYTNGAAQDIKQASEIARKMVCDWGMSEKIGPISLGKKDEEVFLGREISTHRDFSDATAQEIDREIKRIIQSAQNTALQILQDNMDQLHLLAQTLLEREILDGAEINTLMQGKKLSPVSKSNGTHTKTESHGRKSGRDTSTRLKEVDEVLKKVEDKEAPSTKNATESTTSSSASSKDDSRGERRPQRRKRYYKTTPRQSSKPDSEKDDKSTSTSRDSTDRQTNSSSRTSENRGDKATPRRDSRGRFQARSKSSDSSTSSTEESKSSAGAPHRPRRRYTNRPRPSQQQQGDQKKDSSESKSE
ncbi:ATP-dependent zinc metalloprotease FtsH [bacterium]|nr:ATP-dependent zinc metalloprotease FtsH [bacterium]